MGLSVLGFGAGVRDRLCADPGLCDRTALAAGAGIQEYHRGLRPFFERIILPTCTLSFIYVALIARMTRAAMLDVLGEDYVRTARAKGINETGVLLRHALRNAAVPVITVIGTGFALLISGVVVTESVFNLPGIGRLTVDAVLARDYPVIQAMILLTSLIYVTVNLLIDVAYTLPDPEDPVLMAIETVPSRRSRSPRRSGRGSISDGNPDHRRGDGLPVAAILSAISAPLLSPHDPLPLAPAQR
jgi:hypothetical protein